MRVTGSLMIAVAVLTACSSRLATEQTPADPTIMATVTTNNTTNDTTNDTADVVIDAVDGPVEAGPTVRVSYGDAPQQFADLSVPAFDRPAPVVVLIHGGFWRNQYDLSLMEPLADDLVARGYAVWNLEYRRIGDDGGGWPGTLQDVADGIDALVDAPASLDLTHVAVVGHSAGGHLALWAAGRADLPADAPGAAPVVTPVVVIGQGAVVDLAGAAEAGLGAGAVVALLGGTPTQQSDRYRWATANGTGIETVSIVGSADAIVPPAFSIDREHPDRIDLIEIEHADHFDLIDPTHPAWLAVVERLDATIGRPG